MLGTPRYQRGQAWCKRESEALSMLGTPHYQRGQSALKVIVLQSWFVICGVFPAPDESGATGR